MNEKKRRTVGFKFKPFSPKQLKLLNWWTENSPVKDKFMCIADGSVRSGKEQSIDSKLYTPDGYKTFGDIKVGDYVFDRKGNKTKVLGVFPQGVKDVYKVTFDDGSSTECGKEHLWSYYKNGNLVTSTLEYILDNLDEGFKFPINGSVEFNAQDVKFDPYILGLFLGGGKNCDIDFSCSKIQEISNGGVPNEYKFNSKIVRYEVLLGIIEANGVEFRSQTLLNDVIFLARSLGMFVRKESNRCIISANKFRTIESIDYIGKKECICIMVDNDEQLYLTDDFIVTHNTVVCTLSFMLYTMNKFNEQNLSLVGKTVGSLRRNVIGPLKQILLSLGYEIIEHRSENYLEIKKGNIINYYYLFGGRDESSQDLIQGLTLAGAFCDEAVLFPESFWNQLLARLSIEGAKVWVSCNPNSPYHWFYRNVLKQLKEKDGIYIHFTMRDNPSLSEDIIQRYEKMYSGVWRQRYIEGRWAAADGLIYDMFTKENNIVYPDQIPYRDALKWCVGVDYGTGNATAFLLCMKTFDGDIYVCKEYYFAGRKEAQASNNYEAQKTDLEFTEDMIKFLGENFSITELVYNKIDIIVDPAAASFKLQLKRSGLKTRNAINSVIDGVRTVATLFGEGKLKVSIDCKNLIQELHTYMWDEAAQLRGVDKPDKTTPDHACDALRYAVMKLRDKDKISNVTRNIGL